LLLIHYIVDHIFGSLCYWCNWFVTLLVLLLVHHVVSQLHYSHVHTWTPLCCFFALLVVILVACVLVRYYPHHHRLEGGKLMVPHVIICLSLLGNHHCHLPPLVLLSIRRVVGVIIGSLFCLCFGELLSPPIALHKWCNSHVVKRKWKNCIYVYKKNWIIFVNACILGCKANFGLLIYHTSIWFFFHLRATFSCENWKWPNSSKNEIMIFENTCEMFMKWINKMNFFSIFFNFKLLYFPWSTMRLSYEKWNYLKCNLS
jgi:hypothetical protein